MGSASTLTQVNRAQLQILTLVKVHASHAWQMNASRFRLDGAKMMSALMLVVLAVLAVVPFLPTASPPSPCVTIAAIDHWQFVDERTVVIEGAEHRRYRIAFTKACPDAKTGTLALIQRQPSAGACLAVGDAIIFARRTSPTNFKYDESCVVKTITQMIAP